ncbi:MAG: general secretion pathway protein H [Halioglobus sp.]
MARGREVLGFTLLELLAALAIAGMVLAVSVPSSIRMYESMQYHKAVRDVITLFSSARYKAIQSGYAQSVEVQPDKSELRLNSVIKQIPEGVRISVDSAGELNRGNVGVIRFYPEGGTSGGSVSVEAATGRGVKVSVDWLLGTVTQEKYDFN